MGRGVAEVGQGERVRGGGGQVAGEAQVQPQGHDGQGAHAPAPTPARLQRARRLRGAAAHGAAAQGGSAVQHKAAPLYGTKRRQAKERGRGLLAGEVVYKTTGLGMPDDECRKVPTPSPPPRPPLRRPGATRVPMLRAAQVVEASGGEFRLLPAVPPKSPRDDGARAILLCGTDGT